MKLKLGIVIIILCSALHVKAQNKYAYNPAIDVQHSDFNLLLNDTNDTLKGNAVIVVKFKQAASGFSLDLINVNASGKGMAVSEVKENSVNTSSTNRINFKFN